jgi:hypothetical protein
MLSIMRRLGNVLLGSSPPKDPVKPAPAPVVAKPVDDFDDAPDPRVAKLDGGLKAALDPNSDGGAQITKAEVQPLLNMVQPLIFSPMIHDPDRARVNDVLGKYESKMSDDASRAVSWFRLAADE